MADLLRALGKYFMTTLFPSNKELANNLNLPNYVSSTDLILSSNRFWRVEQEWYLTRKTISFCSFTALLAPILATQINLQMTFVEDHFLNDLLLYLLILECT